MLIEKLDTPVTSECGEVLTHMITSSKNGMVTRVFVTGRMAELFERAMKHGEQQAYAKVREFIRPILSSTL